MENQSGIYRKDPAIARVDLAGMEAVGAACGLRIGSLAELTAAVAVTEALIGARLAPVEIIARAQAHTRVTTWVGGNPVNAFFLFAPLSEAGAASVRDGSFVPAAFRNEDVVVAGERCAGIYCGVYAGATHDARKAVMTFSAMLRVKMFSSVPTFARAATADGARSMLSLGFQPAVGAAPDIYVWEADVDAKADAA